MTIKVNLNADMAEGYGAYDIGNDREILRIIGSASIACGFHAGDQLGLPRTIAEVSRLGVSVGAHPGFNDLWGFGRRRIDMRADDLESVEPSALAQMKTTTSYSGVKVTHLKP